MSKNMISVRIRESGSESVSVASVPFTESGVADALALLSTWGLVSADGRTLTYLAGQFELTSTGVSFVIISEGSE